MIWLLALLMSLIPGCSSIKHTSPPKLDEPPAYGTIYICLALPQESLPGALAAVDKWDRALHRWRAVEAIEGYNSVCSYWVGEVAYANMYDPYALAWASAIGGHEVYMRKGRYEIDVEGILSHELGHCFGAQHVPMGLMAPTWIPNGYKCPDILTLAQVAAWNQLPLTMMRWYVEYKIKKRTKILSSKGFDDYGKEVVYFSAEENSRSKLKDFSASTYNLENGVVVISKVPKNDFLLENLDKGDRMAEKFAFPQVKEGSILEYSLTYRSYTISQLNDWEFQKDIPCLWGHMEISIPDFYNYSVFKKGNIHIPHILSTFLPHWSPTGTHYWDHAIGLLLVTWHYATFDCFSEGLAEINSIIFEPGH